MMLQTTYDEEHLGYQIDIELNPEQYNESFLWSICKDDNEWDALQKKH
jgi:hypothetical protein